MDTLRRIIKNDTNISFDEYESFFDGIFSKKHDKCALIALLSALSAKEPNHNDMIAFVRYIERETPKKKLDIDKKVINIVGTGGGIPSFNISTTSCFVAAAAGATVLKSGSYSYNSKCGSLDLLARLGIKLGTSEHQLYAMLEELGIGFLSPQLYPPILRRIAVSIIPFNLKVIGGFINTIGPLICPYEVQGQICGVRSHDLVGIFARALQSLGMNNTISVWSEVGLDEFSAIGTNYYAEINGDIKLNSLEPMLYGLKHDNSAELNGASDKDNEHILRSILNGSLKGVAHDTVALNAAYALILSGKTDDLHEALDMTKTAIADGSALKLLDNIITYSHDTACETVQ